MKSVQKSLVAFDTNHIKEYVFGTDRLKEIRGASSLLDRLNRSEMINIAREYGIKDKRAIIYTNGGSGLFVVDNDKAKDFGKHVQRRYREMTGGGASITFVVQSLPKDAPEDLEKLLDYDLSKDHILELMRYKLREKKASPSNVLALSSHPFMRSCDACGIFYAGEEDPDEPGTFYCASCKNKRDEDDRFKALVGNKGKRAKEFLWGRIFSYLDEIKYSVGELSDVERPSDFNEFRLFAESKEYIGLIYADANNMGTKLDDLTRLRELKAFAGEVDEAIFLAMSHAIKEHLPILPIERKKKEDKGQKEFVSIFPFDILLVGGDDIVMVTDAAKAMEVSLKIAQEFRTLTKNRHSLSIGVVLAPVKYPFGLLQDMAESALKFAKKAAADERAEAKDPDQFDGTRINFQVVTGGSHPDFNETYKEVYRKINKIGRDKELDFHASLRPYKPKDLERLLKAIREGHKLNLGRTKLHQLREAVFEKNLTTSVQKGLATLHHWRDRQRAHVVGEVYEFGNLYQMPRSDPRDPVSGFPRVTFPWFADGKEKGRDVYRTPLLDFIELYDFVAREGGNNGNEA